MTILPSRFVRRCLPLALALASLVSPQAAGELPDLGDSAVGDLPLFEERRIASESMRELRRSGELLDDAEVADYLHRLGYRLVAHSGDSRIRFRFHPIQSTQINAWAIPGGLVGINAGLILLSQHESELAAVMAHEIAHVTQHHYARMVESQKGAGFISLATLALAILAARNGSPDMMQGTIAASQGLQLQRYLAFSRDLEREADRAGMQTLQAAGFDAKAMPAFFDRMHRFYRNVDNGAFAFLRTHPVTLERVADSQARAEALPYRQWSDSADYLFVREKLRNLTLSSEEALAYYQSTTRENKFNAAAAQYYGHAYAAWRAQRMSEAEALLRQAQAIQRSEHPMLARLAVDIQQSLGNYAEAARLLEAARERFPTAPALIYAQIDLHLQQGDLAAALRASESALLQRPDDDALHRRLADTYSRMGRAGLSHRAMAEYYALRDEPTAAIQQLQVALKQGGDFYQMSALEARIRELRALLPLDKRGRPIATEDAPR